MKKNKIFAQARGYKPWLNCVLLIFCLMGMVK